MHSVTIDAHSVAPAPVSALISTTLMNVGFLAIFRVFSLFSSTEILSFMQNSLMLTGVLSLLIAAGYMLKAYHIKRMFAYSSLEMMGLVAIALGSGKSGYYAAILLVILHSLVKSSIFFSMGQFKQVNQSYELKQVGNYMKNYSAGALLLLCSVIFIIAIPPSGIFISEILIFKSLIEQQQWLTFIITALLLTAVIYALLTRVLHILFSDASEPIEKTNTGEKINVIETVPQYVLLLIVAVLCFYQPPFLVDAINASIESLPK
jgi:hydrogenase-4 component F